MAFVLDITKEGAEGFDVDANSHGLVSIAPTSSVVSQLDEEEDKGSGSSQAKGHTPRLLNQQRTLNGSRREPCPHHESSFMVAVSDLRTDHQGLRKSALSALHH